ncbi:MAG: type II secretion system minor pseudopilin GspK [Gammaproteobacteria bacterium]|nr:type II secretion system minor pseudopilin GspK [Gammaproteobacteria bacterium]MCW9029906.1 type II secretion system minor pseudopilin GspK [Gammaproteobacteria bacterium]
MSFSFKQQEKGIALITVMLILALATILAVSMSSRQQLDIHRSANILNLEQAYQYILGAEAWGKQILTRDSQDNKVDSLNDDWATILPALPIEGGKMTGRIEDLQARFNINNLVQNGKTQKLYVDRFKRLLRNLELNEDISLVIIDWLDADEETGFSGAEDNEYLNLSPAYRTANQAMHDVSELLLVKNIDFATYEKLRPFVCVLQSETAINVNTASAEVLSSIVKDLSLEDAKSLVEDRNKETYEKVDDFIQHPLLKQKKVEKDGLSVSTQYFQLSSTTQIERVNVEYLSVLYRDNEGRVNILSRNRGVM